MSFLNDLKCKKDNLNHTLTMVRRLDGTLCKEDVCLGTSEVVSFGLGYVVDNKPNLTVTKVTEGLLMGSQDVAHSQVLLRTYGINCIISLGIDVPKFDRIKYIFIEVLDLPEFNILDIFKSCFSIIDSEREKNNVVYVHCNAGISRSATLVIGYIMKVCRMDFEMAFDHVSSKRPGIRPNEGFVRQLLEYEKYLIETNYL